MIQAYVAICIPCYEKPEALKRLLDSIEIQTYKNYKIYLTDDSQTDFVEKIASLYRQVDYKRNSQRLGPTANCNKAIREGVESGAKYIKIMHHDDCFVSSDALFEMVRCIEENDNVDFIYSDSCTVYDDKVVEHQWSSEQEQSIRENTSILYRHNWIGAPSCTLIRNSGNHSFYFDENLIWLVDIELYMRILYENTNFIHVRKNLVNIYADGNSVTNFCYKNPKIILKEYWYIFLHDRFVRKGNYGKLLYMIWTKGMEIIGI